jgi:hypothetical protein
MVEVDSEPDIIITDEPDIVVAEEDEAEHKQPAIIQQRYTHKPNSITLSPTISFGIEQYCEP